jgi:hypothetical protein
LVCTIIYGAYTGQIKSQAPWDKQLHPENVAPSIPTAPVAPKP